MQARDYRCVYGPVPSRRLGSSLGVDLVPFKTCTYDCLYCQLGRTTDKTVERGEYVPVADALRELEAKLEIAPTPDYISLAGSGEPTLNRRIGELIRGIKAMTAIPVAVLTNGSLLFMTEVQDALMAADLVLPSLDAGDEWLFRHVNRPHAGLAFDAMVDGIAAFTTRFAGEVWLEVFLLAGVTGLPAEADKIAMLARRIDPARVQLNMVSRPPAEAFALPLPAELMHALAARFPGTVDIIGEDLRLQAVFDERAGANDADLLALLRRRPCTSGDVARGLGLRMAEVVKRLDVLAGAGKVKTIIVDSRIYYAAVG